LKGSVILIGKEMSLLVIVHVGEMLLKIFEEKKENLANS